MRNKMAQDELYNLRRNETLNLASYVPETKSLGPGIRAAIWVQGCPFSCPECIAPEWIPIRKSNYVQVNQLAKEIITSRNINGITISGGEPLLQAKPLSSLLNKLRSFRDLDVICFTGFTYEDLLQLPVNSHERQLLNLVDVLVDGPYIAGLNNNLGLRGSSNQRIIHLTNRLSNFNLEEMARQVEIRITNQSIMMVGIPANEALKAINNSYYLLQNSPGGRNEWT